MLDNLTIEDARKLVAAAELIHKELVRLDVFSRGDGRSTQRALADELAQANPDVESREQAAQVIRAALAARTDLAPEHMTGWTRGDAADVYGRLLAADRTSDAARFESRAHERDPGRR